MNKSQIIKDASEIIFYTTVSSEKQDINFFIEMFTIERFRNALNYLQDTTTSKEEWIEMESELRNKTLNISPELWI